MDGIGSDGGRCCCSFQEWWEYVSELLSGKVCDSRLEEEESTVDPGGVDKAADGSFLGEQPGSMAADGLFAE